ncbi:MAG: hypothetical protein KDD89_01800 [Anaerolineales bacterium]|nr:hypothetical protein [Anaerolineales bacterium]
MSVDAQNSYSTVTTAPPVLPGEGSPPLLSKWQIALIVLGSVVAFVLLTAVVIFLAATFPAEIEAIRDIFIIIFAASACSSVVVLIMLLYAIIRLINMLEYEIKPILEKTNETITMVQGTTTFVSTNVVRPSITVRSYVAGLRRSIRVLFGDPDQNLPR